MRKQHCFVHGNVPVEVFESGRISREPQQSWQAMQIRDSTPCCFQNGCWIPDALEYSKHSQSPDMQA